jgi:hypothetical protein
LTVQPVQIGRLRIPSEGLETRFRIDPRVRKQCRNGDTATIEMFQELGRHLRSDQDRIVAVRPEQGLDRELADLANQIGVAQLPRTRSEAQIEVRVEIVGFRRIAQTTRAYHADSRVQGCTVRTIVV